MDRELFWELFRDTGDPLCWLMTRAKPLQPRPDTKKEERKEDKSSAPG